ncbi:MAG: tetratricopeptide repeat protein [Deltaproteobacteria bacterium]|nr:tetratricopeptide repeat protein [Deltaproteobacteria bacterium]
MAKDEIPTLRDAEEAYEAGDIETALAICDGLIGEDETKATPEVLYLAGECLLELQEETEALHLFELALGQEPENPLLLHCKGLCLFELGKPGQARKLFERSAAAAPQLAEPVFYLGLLAERSGDHGVATAHFTKAVDLDPENFVMPKAWDPDVIRGAFDDMVADTPEPLSTWLAALPVEVTRRPEDAVLVRQGAPISPLVHCLFFGTPSDGPEGDDPERWFSAKPDQVVLYSDNLGKSAQDEYELGREVSEAVLWEILEFLGLDDEQLEALGVLEADDQDDDDIHPSG